ncbi:MAG: hypothetical protein IMZ55_00890 [Acidobacteria bacterium]|nr:hypothetical protein [Acidobacteriota bacterium]
MVDNPDGGTNVVGAEGATLPLPRVEVEQAAGFDCGVGIAREDPGAMLPRAKGIFVEPPPDRLATDGSRIAWALVGNKNWVDSVDPIGVPK